jgi:hypothetical protein
MGAGVLPVFKFLPVFPWALPKIYIRFMLSAGAGYNCNNTLACPPVVPKGIAGVSIKVACFVTPVFNPFTRWNIPVPGGAA